MKKYLGIEIGGTKLQVVSGNEDARIDHRFSYSVDRLAGAEGIRRHITEALNYWKDEQVHGIGVGFGGPVNRHNGTIWKSYHISGWSGFPLADWLTELSHVQVTIENDANTAAIGEALYGAGKNENIVFYITLGSGVGGGLVVDKKLYHGGLPGEAEFGHIRLDKTGRIVQSSCAGWAVNEKIKKVAIDFPHSEIALLAKNVSGVEAKILLKALQHDDAHAKQIFEETMDDLAFGISHVVHLFHPDVVILGGGLSHIGEPLREAVSERLINYLMDAFQPGPAIRISTLKEDAVPVGALALARQMFNS
jgi:glucokinase